MALKADRHTPYRDGELIEYSMAAAAKIYAGSIVVISAGYAAKGSAAENLVCIGRAEEQVDNSSGAAGDKTIQVRAGKAFRWKNATAAADKVVAADIGKSAYIVDEETVSKTATGRSKAGRIVGLDDEGVWVYVPQG